jgi:hypothetical protein
MEFYIAQIIGIITAIIAVCMMQFKNLKLILLGQLTTNLLAATSYILLGGLSGGGISIIAIVQSLVMFFYNQKSKKPQWWLLLAFILAYLTCSVVYYKTIIDIFPAISAVLFAISIAMDTPFSSRIWYVFNPISWIIYDVVTTAYGNLLVHALVFVSTAVALVRVDDIFGLKKRKKSSSNDTCIEK